MTMPTTTPGLVPADDLRHRVPAGEKTRDSLFWNVIIPEEQIGVQVYVWIDGRGRSGRQVAVWGPDAEPLAFESEYTIDIGDAEIDDVDLAGLHLRQPELLQTSELSYRGEKVALEYSFEGLHAPFNYGRNAKGSPSWMATERFEQVGRVRGTAEVAGRTIAFDRLGHRDHSWGRRNWKYPQHWKWIVASTPSGRALNAFLWVAQGEIGANGYVLRDGEVVPIVDARSTARYDDDGTQRHLEAELRTEDGETTHLVMDRYAVFELSFGSDSLLWEAACTATIDGEQGAGQFETQWSRSYIEHLVGRS
jgi:hypothetical protein